MFPELASGFFTTSATWETPLTAQIRIVSVTQACLQCLPWFFRGQLLTSQVDNCPDLCLENPMDGGTW